MGVMDVMDATIGPAWSGVATAIRSMTMIAGSRVTGIASTSVVSVPAGDIAIVLSPAMQARIRRGQRLDPQLRSQMHWLPADLSRRYGPAPRGYRYAIIGGNVVVIDEGYNVWDSFGLDITIR